MLKKFQQSFNKFNRVSTKSFNNEANSPSWTPNKNPRIKFFLYKTTIGSTTTLQSLLPTHSFSIKVLVSRGPFQWCFNRAMLLVLAWHGPDSPCGMSPQAGQFIQYGCGKGECGTCECMMNGKWVRPCIATAGDLIVQVKAVKSKSVSSGKFFSIRSFLMGFWNNFLGMIGFVKFRKAARNNWEERKSYDDLVLQKTMAKKLARARAEAAELNQQNGRSSPGSTSPGMA